MRSYYADVEAYEAWCIQTGHVAFPAHPATVSAFIEEQGKSLAPSTVQRRLYGIRKAHRLLGLDDPTRHEDVNLAMRRVRRTKTSRPRQAKGMTRSYLEKFLSVQPDTPWGKRNRAMLSLGYDVLARRSELVALRTDDLIWQSDGTLSVLVRRSKTDQFGKGRVAFTSLRSAKLVDAWLAWRPQEIGPLFCPIYQNVAIDRGLSDTTVKDIIKHSARAAGLEPSIAAAFSGHSMRVGAAQDLLEAGHSTSAIMRAGGWKSVEVLSRYLEISSHNVWT
ncbi:MAG: tyrosine-type recombinase/integrase [Pseudomonadota bacterium]|nr:tyrosine-type recombinase/integrase [Pseudomonadota bacterium]